MKARIGEILKHWRAIRGLSQRALAERAGVSTRHLAFVESGKAQPSRDAVLWLAGALAVPETEKLAFLEAAGYLGEARGGGARLDEALRAEIAVMLAGLEPHPALVHDVDGTLIAVNDALTRAARPFVTDIASFVGERSGGHRLIAALEPHLLDGRGLQEHYLRRVRDALLRGHGAAPPALLTLFDSLAAGDTAEAALDRRVPHPLLVRVALRPPESEGTTQALRFDALTATLGTPMAMTLRTLRLLVLLPVA